MCGISFIFDMSAHERTLRHRTQLALDSMRHRGPDGVGLDSGECWAIGHRRLSIIDIEGSSQPMWDVTRRFCLSYNGEIYNYKELRAQLKDKWQFQTNGDTEVLLAGLILQGRSFLKKLEGMWGFSFWDTKEKCLLLSRDRMGKKPLYYRIFKEGFACASELPSLACLFSEKLNEDLDSTADYFRYGFALPGYTAYQDIKEVLPGHTLKLSPHETPVERAYWTLTPEYQFNNSYDAGIQLRDALKNATKRRLVADVEVGAFLSGGIDSTLICSIITKTLKQPLKSFTIGFSDSSYDERHFAKIAANELGTEHYEEILNCWNEEKLEQLLLNHVGQPFADASLLPTALVSEVAAQHVKVALSGDGGDELFSGYQRYQARNILRWYSRLPNSLRFLAEKAVRALPEPMVHHSRSIVKKAHLFMDVIARQNAETPYYAPLILSPDHFRRVVPELEGYGHTPPNIPETTELDDIHRMMLADSLIYLPQDILTKVDRASMASSLEVRAPFLDSEVVKLAFSVPRKWHRNLKTGKNLLRDNFSGMFPDQLWKRRKQGFGVPLHGWFRGELGNRLMCLSHETSDSPLSEHEVSSLIDEHRKGGRDHGYRLWVLYAYLMWKKSFL